jgi:flagellar motor switch protein FliN/FliY
MANSIKMLLDIKAPISVQLGQTRMNIRELLHLEKGSLVELDRMAGEPVDIFIAKKMLAKGEVTVVNDNLAVRIGQLYDEKEKYKHL